MQDILQREDVVMLVREFYSKVNEDPLLAPLFAHVNWPSHFPTMYDFWSSMLLGERSYTGNPFQKHMPLAIKAEHFERWISLFHQTVDELFTGEKATEAKDRARSIAHVWQHKLGLFHH